MLKKTLLTVSAIVILAIFVNPIYAHSYYCEYSDNYNNEDGQHIRNYVDVPETTGDIILFKVVDHDYQDCDQGRKYKTLPFNSDAKRKADPVGSDERLLVCLFNSGKYTHICTMKEKSSSGDSKTVQVRKSDLLSM